MFMHVVYANEADVYSCSVGRPWCWCESKWRSRHWTWSPCLTTSSRSVNRHFFNVGLSYI